MKLNNNIPKLLKKDGISIKKLGEGVGLSYPSIYRIVTTDDLCTTKLGNIVEIAKFLNVDITKIYEEEY